jgi:error-prone DNA polymerase
MRLAEYTELQVSSNFSFLEGASHPEELVQEAKHLNLSGIALTDKNSLAGIVRAHKEAKKKELPFFVGARLELLCPAELHISTNTSPLESEELYRQQVLAYPTTREGYGRLSRLLTTGKMRGEKDECILGIDDLLTHQKDLVITLVPPVFSCGFQFSNQTICNFHATCKVFSKEVDDRRLLSIALVRNYAHESHRSVQEVLQISKHLCIPPVAVNDVFYHSSKRRVLQDVLTCIREKTTIQQAGYKLFPNSERSLKSPEEMRRLFREIPEAITRTMAIHEMLQGFSLDQLTYTYPSEICVTEKSPLEYLSELSWEGAQERYPDGIPAKVRRLIQEELKLIHELQYEKYFLTCYDIVRFARSRGILCQGRGAAANSTVCYCLGITAVDPDRIDLLFARFVSKERNEPPDIDIDFEHERREEVLQYIYEKYGRERAALVCEVVCFRARSAIREVGKALGLSLEVVDQLAKSLHRWTGCTLTPEDLRELGLSPEDPTVWNTLVLCQLLQGFPRHLSQHVGGFIISEDPLCEIVPISHAAMENRTVIEWDKDDVEELGMLKIDCLGLGMLTCIRKALAIINSKYRNSNKRPLELYSIPAEEPAVYDMICASDTIGVFQIESRAQMSMLPRLRPRCFYDLVIEVAIVRPGPIHGDMVHPFLKRRQGKEQVHYPDKEVKEILGKTVGVHIFQEQAMRLAVVLAGFSPGEAEQLRRAMGAWKKNARLIEEVQGRIIEGMNSRGYTTEFAQSCVNQLKGFSEYGFPESHAASFALLVYASAWIKHHYPEVFAAALINSQPMGFYSSSQIIADAKRHGVTTEAIDVNHSNWDCFIEDQSPRRMRSGFRLVRGLQKEQAEIVAAVRSQFGRFSSIQQIWNNAGSTGLPLRRSTLLTLARADAFSSLGLQRREALWQIRGLPPQVTPLDTHLMGNQITPRAIKPLSTQMEMFLDYEKTGFSLRGHPVATARDSLRKRGVKTAAELATIKQGLSHGVAGGVFTSAAGLSVVRQRPRTSKGVVFITLEDETGMVNLIIRPKIFERYQKIILLSSALVASGFLQTVTENDTSDLVYILVTRLEGVDEQIMQIAAESIPVKNYSY